MTAINSYVSGNNTLRLLIMLFWISDRGITGFPFNSAMNLNDLLRNWWCQLWSVHCEHLSSNLPFEKASELQNFYWSHFFPSTCFWIYSSLVYFLWWEMELRFAKGLLYTHLDLIDLLHCKIEPQCIKSDLATHVHI